MTKRYRVSRDGLTRCPKCARHIFLAERWLETDCQFCGAQLVAGAPPAAPPQLDRIRKGRSGLIAAGLLSFSLGATGCLEDKDPSRGDQGIMMPSTDMGVPESDSGGPLSDMSMERNDFAIDQPVYGAVGPDAALDAAPDPGPQPEYGAPPAPEPDAGPDAALDLAPDLGSQPEYGAPPEDAE